ncbi:hypothetical protein [Pedococcus bigeumensis]|uniref:Uncharacterized protein n=1 Tax=Pedococcus bigeumensis TaxID=433644 RepID=A0A502CIV8_9MICO|nr:hypothetical protein [Pedococcus bigeumensis]TPG12554.1 hypothetical protein EAH86_19810 [Pedococcus bigeumensis]
MMLPDRSTCSLGNEIRPNPKAEADPKTFGGVDPILAEDHRLWIGGYDAGYAAGRQDASVDLACGWLHAEARRWTDQAVTLAEANHGKGWSDEIRAQAEGVAA